jgi:Dyp-type peroxidase family
MPQEPLLPVKNIQGNISPGFNKDFQALLFLNIVDVSSFKRWLKVLLPSITTMERVLDFKCLIKKGAHGNAQPRATWLNIAFSHSAFELLGALQDGDFKDEAFREGLWRRSKDLGDPTDEKSEGYQGNWRVGGEKNEAHLVIIIASDDPQDLSMVVDRIRATIYAPGSGAQITFEQSGAVLPGLLAGHEHFGFRDGVSQPGVRGLIAQNPDGVLTPRQNPKKKHQGTPGQDLLWPGEFIFGYPGQDAKKEVEEPGEIVDAGPPWARDGSFLVFRRLRQDVGAFHQFLHETAQRLNLDVGLFGAKCVGRWTSGAPILRTPDLDDASLAQDDLRNNDFEFQGDEKTPADQKDPQGKVCPFAGHIRKTYPRDDIEESETQTHRLLRRGIPYGEPSCSAPHAPVYDSADRGLLFLAYQTSIVRQFEVVQKEFANNPDFKEKGAGHDPIIGQNGKSKEREREFRVTFKDYDEKEQQTTVQTAKEWVIPTGGGYFFAPSLAALAWLAGDVQEN